MRHGPRQAREPEEEKAHVPHRDAPTIDDAPEASRPLLDSVKRAIGSAPNLYRLTAQSPAALQGLIGFNGALGAGALDFATRERIALVVAEANGCDYCLAAHSYLASHVAKLDPAEIAANREGGSSDAKAAAALTFAAALVAARGKVGADAVTAVRAAGHSDAAIIEIVAAVALNTFTNYLNSALETEIDFPAAAARRAA